MDTIDTRCSSVPPRWGRDDEETHVIKFYYDLASDPTISRTPGNDAGLRAGHNPA
jgi:hypothetical protein